MYGDNFLWKTLTLSMNTYKLKLIRIFSQACLVMGLSTIAITFDLLPNYRNGNLTFTTPEAIAQTPTDEQLQKYANAAVKIENLRRNTYNNIQGIVGDSQSTQLSCNKREKFKNLPDNARSMAVDYCQQSEAIVKQNGLTINQFNQITQQIKKDRQLYQKLQQFMGQ